MSPNFSRFTAVESGRPATPTPQPVAAPLRVGDRVRILTGTHTGKQGVVRALAVTVDVDGPTGSLTYSVANVRRT